MSISYSGNKPYIFLSYSHGNSNMVKSIAKCMKEDGCRIWFDEGITPASDYDDVIESSFTLGIVFDTFEDGSYDSRFFTYSGTIPANDAINPFWTSVVNVSPDVW